MLIIVVVISGALPKLSPLCPQAVPTSRADKEKPCSVFLPCRCPVLRFACRVWNYTMDRRKTQGGALTLKRTGVLIECVPAGYALPLSAVDSCLLMVTVSNFLIPTNECSLKSRSPSVVCPNLGVAQSWADLQCRKFPWNQADQPVQNWPGSLNPKLDSPTGGHIFRFFGP